ncbi:flagellar basal body protein [Hahella sp. HN01]|uniref:flagellar basal body rod protein FlgB n=1 Tax=Hahella sp. NBU794 TaxID=3422590 RepID=UPI001C1EA276|nr:flagellar basal body protein [Hahella sp. HN01]
MEFLTSVTSTLLNKSLDAAQLQQRLIAQNVANASTEGYRAMSLNFKAALQHIDAVANSSLNDADKVDRINNVNFNQFVSLEETAAKVELDEQILALNKNVINYQALLTAKSKLGGIMKLAINGGR